MSEYEFIEFIVEPFVLSLILIVPIVFSITIIYGEQK